MLDDEYMIYSDSDGENGYENENDSKASDDSMDEDKPLIHVINRK